MNAAVCLMDGLGLDGDRCIRVIPRQTCRPFHKAWGIFPGTFSDSVSLGDWSEWKNGMQNISHHPVTPLPKLCEPGDDFQQHRIYCIGIDIKWFFGSYENAIHDGSLFVSVPFVHGHSFGRSRHFLHGHSYTST